MVILLTEQIWTWSHFLFGLTYAIVASLIFLFIVLVFFKPKIRVAPFLCKIQTESGLFYVFKFVNYSYFSAHEIRVQLHQIRKIPMGQGRFNNEYQQLSLLNSEISHIPGRLPLWFKNDANPHCITVRSKDDINKILSEEFNGISLRISLKHGLTGLSKVFDREYANIEDIRNARFSPGRKFATL